MMEDGQASGLVLAVDGGGTHTRGVIVNRSGEVVRLRTGPGCNPYDRSDWAKGLHDVLLSLAGSNLRAATIGLAGYDRNRPSSVEQETVIRTALGNIPHLALENDIEIAHRGAFLGGGGVFLLAGTGSVALAREGQEGRSERAGGWGWLLGDEGSGYWIGREALARTSRAIDDPSLPYAPFAWSLLEVLGIVSFRSDRAADLLRDWLRQQAHPRSAIGNTARLVHDLAVAGDPHAMALLEEAATELATLALTAQKRLSPIAALTAWSYGGSVLGSPHVRAAVTARLGLAPVAPALSPLGGAALQAARLAGWSCDPAWVTRVREGLDNPESAA